MYQGLTNIAEGETEPMDVRLFHSAQIVFEIGQLFRLYSVEKHLLFLHKLSLVFSSPLSHLKLIL